MPRNAGLMHARLFDDITDLLLTGEENLDDTPPRRIGEDLEEVCLHGRVYAPWCICCQALADGGRRPDPQESGGRNERLFLERGTI